MQKQCHRWSGGLLLAALAVAAVAQQARILDFDAIVTRVFWEELHKDGGWTLDCGHRFDAGRHSETGGMVAAAHIYSAEAMLKALRCENREQCRKKRGRRYLAMESDLHNLYPVWAPLVVYRNGARYGLIEGEQWRLEDCDIEWRGGVIEPRPLARGNIARAMLYMNVTYKLPLDPGALDLFRQWNDEDPSSEQELARNDLIEQIQGRRNPYIDDPELARRPRSMRSAAARGVNAHGR